MIEILHHEKDPKYLRRRRDLDSAFQEIYELMFVLDQYNSSDGGVMFDYSSGTNYDTIGLTNTAYSMSNSRQLIDIMNK